MRRWERQRGLPVHRISGGARNLVYAYADELEAWLRSGEMPAEPSGPVAAIVDMPPPIAGSAGRSWPMLLSSALVGVAAIAALGAYLLVGGQASLTKRYEPAPEVRKLYLDAVYNLGTRQAEGFDNAIRQLTEATTRDPNYADGFAKLAEAYNTVSQYTLAPAGEAYPRALAAAERALALEPDNANALAALGFTAFYWQRDLARSRQLFERAIAADPDYAQARHWYALTLMITGETETPLLQVEEALRLNPESRPLIANRALILFYAGRADEAIAVLKRLASTEPKLRSPREYLATIYLDQRRYSDFLREYRGAAEMTGNAARLAIADAAERGFAANGEKGLLEAMLAEQVRQFGLDREPAFKLAGTAAMLGRNDDAIRWLEVSMRRKEPDMLGVWVEPPFHTLRNDPRYRTIVEGVGFHPFDHART